MPPTRRLFELLEPIHLASYVAGRAAPPGRAPAEVVPEENRKRTACR